MSKTLFRDSVGVVPFKRLPETKLTEQKGSVGAWEAPVWNLGRLNLNGRVYPVELGKRIAAEGKVLVSYDGHDGDRFGDYGPVKAVTKNPRVEGAAGEEQLVVEIYVIDEAYQKQLEKISDLGVGIGVSSVGYGETDKDGVVNSHTYEIVRYLDFVTTPAGEVYATPKSEQTEEAGEDLEVSGLETGELSTERLAKVELYKKVQKHILARRKS